MKLRFFYIQTLPLLLAAAVVFLASCKKDDPNEGLDSPRLFKPSGISVRTTDTSATISWTAPILSEGQLLTYTIDLSQDSTFATTDHSFQSDTTALTIKAAELTLRQKYYVRIMANAFENQPASKWLTGGSFTVIGEQFFLPVRDIELTESRVTLRWRTTEIFAKLLLTIKGGTAQELLLTPTDLSNGFKEITGLTSDTLYSAELFNSTSGKGWLSFRTPKPTVYTVVLNPGDDIVAAVTNAANGDVIGLNPGVYDVAGANFAIQQKTITIKSLSNNPADTRINFKEFNLRGSGAGIILEGIYLDGAPNTALYFINLTGAAANNEICDFTQVKVSNCVVARTTTSFFRADRGSNAGDYRMNQVSVRNTLVMDVATTLGYNLFHLDELAVGEVHVSNSTFQNAGRTLISSTALLVNRPTITFDYCTINSIGGNNKTVLMDAGSNPVNFNFTNSIIANTPLPSQTVSNLAVRATGANTVIVFNNNNSFNFKNGADVELSFPAGTTMVGNHKIDLGWTAATQDFTLPAGHLLRTVSSAGSAIGDPRWSY
ncbi:fibronectin type III domain-containing protein [Pseudobacter ginsenosidimutans]|uniref:Uncharacterized protein DUF4957 n=1 Tax=Pseudobacter ginsenosidimutans TaxID=661488 RepID=A0A4Q7N658_9BACT|nr:DUF5123 domain-containing protein [Pseudobacter ginsenosidimutans]QEC45054.1 DUF5123 domain-containing protein [Pseudobacter ginsenosidimutans]RZS76549.1 uncharacterized protein DUF4957 [Pseudobacter ginsenosidimutans]